MAIKKLSSFETSQLKKANAAGLNKALIQKIQREFKPKTSLAGTRALIAPISECKQAVIKLAFDKLLTIVAGELGSSEKFKFSIPRLIKIGGAVIAAVNEIIRANKDCAGKL